MEKWFEFTALNSVTQYGYGFEEEAARYCGHLQRKAEYRYREMDQEESAGLDSGDDTDGFRLDLALDTEAENAAFRIDNSQFGVGA